MPVYEATDHVDGRVSIEVDPRLAHDTEATVEAARTLWTTVDRPNAFIKIPATAEGCPAITQVLAEGISVNVTLIFSLDRYRAVMNAFLDGPRAGQGQRHRPERRSPPSRPSSSPASTPRSTSGSTRSAPTRPRSCAARRASRTPGSPTRPTRRSSPASGGRRWRRPAPGCSARCGRRPASRTRPTRTRMYVDRARRPRHREHDAEQDPRRRRRPRRDHRRDDPGALRRGRAGARPARAARHRLRRGDRAARARGRRQVREELGRAGPDRQRRARARRRRAPRAPRRRATSDVDANGSGLGARRLRRRRGGRGCVPARPAARAAGRRERGQPAGRLAVGRGRPVRGVDPARLGRPARDLAGARAPDRVAAGRAGRRGRRPRRARRHGWLLARPRGHHAGPPACRWWCSTAPTRGRCAARWRTAWSAPSSSCRASPAARSRPTASGARSRRPSGTPASTPPGRIVVVTDPGSPLEKTAADAGYRAVFHADPHVGGRYSALTAFGLVPSGLAGADIGGLLDQAAEVADLLSADDEGNPALILGRRPRRHRPAPRQDRVLDEGSGIVGFADWAEQLIAESTGKEGKGLLPVVAEGPGAPDVTGGADDVLVVRLVSAHTPVAEDDGPTEPRAVSRDAVTVGGPLGAQLLLWEYAVAIAGRLLGHQPLRPAGRRERQEGRSRPARRPPRADRTPTSSTATSRSGPRPGLLGGAQTLEDAVGALLATIGPHGYLAVMAYLTARTTRRWPASEGRWPRGRVARSPSAGDRASCTPPGSTTRAGRPSGATCRSPRT